MRNTLLIGALAVIFSCRLIAQTPELGLPVGHTKAVTAVAFSPDGQLALTGALDNLAKLWDLEGRVLRTFHPATGPVTEVGFSPKGTCIYTRSGDSTVLWSLDGRVILRCNSAPVFSPDESKVLYKARDTLFLRNMKTGSRQRIATGPKASGAGIFSVPGQLKAQFYADGQLFIRLSDTGLELWTAAGARRWSVPLPPHMAYSAVFAPNAPYILVASADGAIAGYDLSGKKIYNIGTPSPDQIMFSCIGSAMSFPILWAHLGFSADHKKLFCSTPSSATVYDVGSAGAPQNLLRPAYTLPLLAPPEGTLGATQSWENGFGHILQISPDGAHVIWRYAFNTKIELKNREGQVLSSVQGLFGPNCNQEMIMDLADRAANAVFDPSGKTVLIGLADGSAEIRRLDGTLLQRFQSGLTRRTARVADLSETGYLLLRLTDQNPPAYSSWWSNKEQDSLLALGQTVSLDLHHMELRPFSGVATDTASLPALRRFLEEIKTRPGRFIAPDARYAIEGVENPNVSMEKYLNPGLMIDMAAGTVKVYEAAKLAFQFWEEEDGSVSDVCLSPDEKYLAVSPSFGPPKLWDFQRLKNPANPQKKFETGYDDNVYLDPAVSDKCLIRVLKNAPKRSYFLGFAPDSRSLLIKEYNLIHQFSLEGNLMRTFKGHRLAVTGASFLQNGKFILSWGEDHTARLWDAATGAELAAAIFLENNDWVVTTPQGLFDASGGAMQMMYYIIGLEPIEIDQIKERYYEPNLLPKLLGYDDEPVRIVEQFDAVKMYPRVKLTFDSVQNNLTVRLSPRNGGVGKVSLFINNKEVIEEANPPKGAGNARDSVIRIDLKPYAQYFLSGSINTISVRAYNAEGWLKSAPYSVSFRAAAGAKGGGGVGSGGGTGGVLLEGTPTLYIVAVGTADYSGKNLDLTFAGKDARDMAIALQQVGKQLFADKVSVTLLTTDTAAAAMQPTKANIKAAFDSIKKRAKAQDILVAYFSGHGIAYGDADRAQFYYLTKEIGSFDLSDAGIRDKRAVSSNELTRWINDIPALKQVLILDACNSGKVVENLAAGQKSLGSSQIRALERMKDRTGMFVLTGSAADKVSYEAGQYGQGLLTYSILQFMKSLGNKGAKPVDVMTLCQQARETVPVLAKGIGGIQTPMLAAPLGGASFDIGIVNEKVKIPLSEQKPVFIRCYFQDENLGDELELTQATENHFLELTSLGAQAKLIYLDIGAYENGHSIRGRYKIEGDKVQLLVNLFHNNKALGAAPVAVEGSKNDIPALVKDMLKKVQPLIKK